MAYFPAFNQYLNKVDDFRRNDRIIYPLRFIVFLCVLSRLMKNDANRDTDNEQDEPVFLDNVNKLSDCDMKRLPHSDTLKYLMEGLAPKEFASMRNKLVGRLIRNKVLDNMRVDSELTGAKHFLVALDGVHYHTSHRNLPHSTHKTHTADKTVDYMLTALEAQIVSPEGLRFSLMTEFIENPEEYNKQDCEIKAAKRLCVKLKEHYPRLPIIILLDGLYLCEDIVNLCKKNHWGLSVTVNDKTAAFLAVAEKKIASDPRHRIEGNDPRDGSPRTVTWCNHVKYKFGKTNVNLNVVIMKKINKKGKMEKFVYATTIFLHKRSVIQVLDTICRARWQIEESFKVQKCHGLGLKEAFGTVGNAGQNYYHIVQIAHIILELMLHSSLFRRLQKHQHPGRIRNTICCPMLEWYGTIKNLLNKFKRYLLMVPLSKIDILSWRLEFNTT